MSGEIGVVRTVVVPPANLYVELEDALRTRAITAERLRAIPRRVGVAGGPAKYPAIRAALRGRWINVLITDTASAQRLAEESPDVPAVLPPR